MKREKTAIISIANQKGGVGKSATTMMLANAFSQKPYNYDVLVIDNDPQKSIVKQRRDDKAFINNANYNFPYPVIFPTKEKSLIDLLNEHANNYDLVFIDMPGKLDGMDKLIYNCDFVFIPFESGNLDFTSTVEFISAAIKAKKEREKEGETILINCFFNKFKKTRRFRDLIEYATCTINSRDLNFMADEKNHFNVASLSNLEYYKDKSNTYESILHDKLKRNQKAVLKFKRFTKLFHEQLNNQ